MEHYVIIGLTVLILGIALVSTVKHFRGEGGCCGGGSYKPKRKRLSGIKYRKTFRVDGMHCEHCKRRVEEIVNDIKGLAGKVDLKKGELTVSYAEEVDDEVIRAGLARAGYTLIIL